MSDDKENIDEAIRKRMEGIFPSPEVASQMARIVVSERPLGWSRKSNAPYYKRIYGQQMKQDIDRMIQSGKALIFWYDRWCNERTGMSKKTLYNRINQSIRYVIEKMDTPDEKYAQWYETVKVEPNPLDGTKALIIEFVVGLSSVPSEQFHAEEAEPRALVPLWRRHFNSWLESDNSDPFLKEGLVLSLEEVKEIKKELAGLQHVVASVTPTAIKAVKMNT